MTDVARILLGTGVDSAPRRVLVFRPAEDYFPRSESLFDELPELMEKNLYPDDELYLLVDQGLEHSWYVVLMWDEDSESWYERYDPDNTHPDDELNTDYFRDWHVRTCPVPSLVLEYCP